MDVGTLGGEPPALISHHQADEEEDEERHPSFYKPGSGNILSFFAETSAAPGPPAPFPGLEAPLNINFISSRPAPASSSPRQEAAGEGSHHHHKTPDQQQQGSSTTTSSGACASPGEPAFKFQSHTRTTTSQDEENDEEDEEAGSISQGPAAATGGGVKTRRQLLSEFQQHKQQRSTTTKRQSSSITANKRGTATTTAINRRRHSTSTATTTTTNTNRRSSRLAAAAGTGSSGSSTLTRSTTSTRARALQPVLSRRNGETGRASKAARWGDHHHHDNKENTQPHLGVSNNCWKEQAATMFNMHFSPPSKKQPPQATTVHAVKAAGGAEGDGATAATGGGMFTMVFSPPSKASIAAGAALQQQQQQQRFQQRYQHNNKRHLPQQQPEEEEPEDAAAGGGGSGGSTSPNSALARVTDGVAALSISAAPPTEGGKKGAAAAAASKTTASTTTTTASSSLTAEMLQERGDQGSSKEEEEEEEAATTTEDDTNNNQQQQADTGVSGAASEAAVDDNNPESAVEEEEHHHDQRSGGGGGDSAPSHERSIFSPPPPSSGKRRLSLSSSPAPPSPSHSHKGESSASVQLLETLDDLIEKEKQVKALAEQLVKTEEDAVRWEEAALASQQQIQSLEKDLESVRDDLTHKDQELCHVRRQVEVAATKMAELELQATQAKAGGAACLSEAQLSLLNASQERVLEVEKILLQAQDRAETDRKRLEGEVSLGRACQRVLLEEMVNPTLRALGLAAISAHDITTTNKGEGEEEVVVVSSVVKEGASALQQLVAERDQARQLLEQHKQLLSCLEGKMSSTVAELEQKLRDKDTHMAQTIKSEVCRVEEEAAERVRRAGQDKEAAIKELQTQLEQEEQHTRQSLESRIHTLARAKEDLEMEVKSLREDHRRGSQQAHEQLAEALRRVQEVEADNNTLRQHKEEMSARLSESDARRATLEEELSCLGGQLSASQETAKKLEAQLDVETARLRKDVKTLRADLNKHKESEQGVEEQRRRMVDVMKGLEAQLRAHAKDLHDERETRQSMQEHMLAQRAEIAQLQEEKSGLLCKIDEYRAQARHLDDMHAAMGVRVGRLEDDCEKKDQLRKALHNQVMELKGNIRVFVRVRPPLPSDSLPLTTSGGHKQQQPALSSSSFPFEFVDTGVGGTSSSMTTEPSDCCQVIEVTEPHTYRGGLSEKRRRWRFNYDQVGREEEVFGPRASQESVFAEVGPLVQSALDGYRVCIFAYGQTGSGKTFTMMGPDGGDPSSCGSSRGVVYRAVEQIFSSVQALAQHGWTFRLSMEMVEIYNESIRDLLLASSSSTSTATAAAEPFDPSSSGGSDGGGGNKGAGKGLEIRQHGVGEDDQSVPGLTSVEVRQASEVTSLIARAMARRCTKSTRVNADSSRSHCLFTLHTEGTSSRGQVRKGCLHLVDLAGSERLSKSGSAEDPALLREAQSINKSLSVLGNVISALYRKEKHIPYRESTLTRLLRPSLGGDCKALMFCNLSPCPTHLHESMCSLRFAQKVNACSTKDQQQQG